MPHFRFLAALLLAGALACSASTAAFAGILIQIDKRAQTMTVAVDGQLRYRWPVSTGATGFSTPVGGRHGPEPAAETAGTGLATISIFPVLVPSACDFRAVLSAGL